MPRENTQHQNVTTINSEDATTEGDSPSVRIAGLSPREFAKRVLVILLGSAIVSFGVHNIHNVTGITEGGIIRPRPVLRPLVWHPALGRYAGA